METETYEQEPVVETGMQEDTELEGVETNQESETESAEAETIEETDSQPENPEEPKAEEDKPETAPPRPQTYFRTPTDRSGNRCGP